MREIKFRAWDKSKKLWLTDKDNVYINEEGEAFVLVSGAASDYLSRVNVDIVHYTGLKDKNGKEIYEGDILNNGVVYWSEFMTAWIVKGVQDIFLCIFLIPHEIIGNIHQTPELL